MVGFRIAEQFGFRLEPAFAAGDGQFVFEVLINMHQMCDIGQSIFELFGIKRAQPPIGTAAGFIKFDMKNVFNQAFLTDGLSVAADHGGNLSVKNRSRNAVAEVEKNFDILTAGMENIDYLRIVQNRKERRHIQFGSQRVDDGGLFGGADLNEAEFGVVGFFAQEFQINGNERLSGQVGAEFFQIGSGFD